MTTNDRWTARAGQLTVSAFIHRALTRAGISLVVTATFAATSAHAQDAGTTAQQAPAGAPKQPEETKNQADTLKPKKLILVAANVAAAPASVSLAAAEAAKQPADEATTAGPVAEEESNAGSTISEVTVSGSRIRRTDGFEAPTPVAVMDSSILQEMATSTIAESLTRMPQFSSNLSSSNLSSNVGTGTAGENLVNLRGLGANRTLVLLDGKRMIPASLVLVAMPAPWTPTSSPATSSSAWKW